MEKDYVRETIETYEKIADKYAEKWLNYREESYINLLKNFVNLLKNKEKVLDAGCGPGRDIKILYELGIKEVYGIDLSKNMLNIAKEYESRGKYFVMDIRKLDFDDEFFDGIICIGVLVHLNKEDFIRSLKELYRVLKKEGILLLSVKIDKEEKILIDKKYGEIRYFFIYTEDFIKDSLKNVGFEILETRYNTSPDKEIWLNLFCKK